MKHTMYVLCMAVRPSQGLKAGGVRWKSTDLQRRAIFVAGHPDQNALCEAISAIDHSVVSMPEVLQTLNWGVSSACSHICVVGY